MEDYEKRYKEALSRAATELENCGADKSLRNMIYAIFPDELKESEDERVRKEILDFIKTNNAWNKEWIAWLEKQGGNSAPININKMVMEYSQTKDGDFGLPVNCQIRAYRQGINDALNLSLNLEKQCEQPSAIRWYDVSLIPQEMEELLVEWDSEDATWHEIAFYHADTKTFWNGTRQVENVTRWCYIIDLLEKQGESKPFDYESANIQQKDFAPKQEPKKIEDEIEIPFGAKDSELQEATYYIPDGFHAEIDDDKVVIKKGEKSAAWSEEDKNFMYDTLSNLTELKDRYGEGYGNVGKCIDWLKSLKQRIGG